MAQQRAEIDAIASDPAPPTVENTLEALERSGRLLNRALGCFYNQSSSDSTPGLEAIEEELAPQFAAHSDAIYLDQRLFARVAALQSDVDAGKRISEELVKGIGGKGDVGYVYVAGFAPLDRRNRGWNEVKKANPGVKQVAHFGKVSDSTASDTQEQANAAITANPDLKAVLAPYDEFAKGVVLALGQANKTGVKVYGADISTPDIAVITKADSPWVATIATDPANVGRVAVRAAALKVNGDPVDREVLIQPSVITQKFLRDNKIKTLEQLRAKLPELDTKDAASASWIPKN
jgi:simple sugar transport system substrate-binding protein